MRGHRNWRHCYRVPVRVVGPRERSTGFDCRDCCQCIHKGWVVVSSSDASDHHGCGWGYPVAVGGRVRVNVIHMERRKFLLGVGGSAIGGGALLGSGAFSRIESQRRVKIQVAKDPDAYLGLDECPGSANSSYTGLDDSGHLEIDMSPDNPNIGEAGADDAAGLGVNSDSFTYFDNLFQICNQGKEAAGIWIDATARDPASDLEDDDDYDDYADEDRVIFYNTDDPEDRIDSQDNAYVLDVGECKCIGMRVMTKGLDSGDQLLEDDEIVINADTDVSGTPLEPAEEFTSVARIRRGDEGGAATWELAIKDDFDAPGAEADVTNWELETEYEFEFSYDGTEYELEVTEEGDSIGSLTTDDVPAPSEGSQLRANIRASDSAMSVSNVSVNGTSLGGASADDDTASTSPAVTFDTSDFTVTGAFEFEAFGPGDEQPALDIQVEGFQ